MGDPSRNLEGNFRKNSESVLGKVQAVLGGGGVAQCARGHIAATTTTHTDQFLSGCAVPLFCKESGYDVVTMRGTSFSGFFGWPSSQSISDEVGMAIRSRSCQARAAQVICHAPPKHDLPEKVYPYSGRAQAHGTKVTERERERAQNADFCRKPQTSADSPLLLEIQTFQGRRIFADNRRFSQETADVRRKPQIGLCHLRCVTFSLSALQIPVQLPLSFSWIKEGFKGGFL